MAKKNFIIEKSFIKEMKSILKEVRVGVKAVSSKSKSKKVRQELATAVLHLKEATHITYDYQLIYLSSKISTLVQEKDYYFVPQILKAIAKRLKAMEQGEPARELAPFMPQNERKRAAAVRKLELLHSKKEKRFDRITKMATKVLKVPISTITLVDKEQEWHKSTCGLNSRGGPRANSFCGHTILEEEVLVVKNAKKDPRFRDNPQVLAHGKNKQPILFYAGIPLRDLEGFTVGTLCIKDTVPHKSFTKKELEKLKDLANWAEIELNTKSASSDLGSLGKEIKKKLKRYEK